jgi:phosphatidylglycerophosphatase A
LIILPNKTIPASYLLNPLHLLSLGFGSGLMPFAPGTFGTLVAIPLYLLMSQLPLAVFLAITSLFFVIGIYLCGFTSRALGVHDHSGIVWDEIVGYLVTMIALPLNVYTVVGGFLCFRFFDIVKPWPIKWADRHLSGGFGIMFDDLLAGIFSAGVLHLVYLLL